jgi:hypothetical protein
MLHVVRQNEGVVMASYHPAYTRCDDPPQVSIDGVVIYIQILVSWLATVTLG